MNDDSYHIRDMPTVVGTDHHSDKIATITNSLTNTKISRRMKILILNSQLVYNTHTYIHNVHKESPKHSLSIEIKDHKFWRSKTHLYNHHSSKPGHIPAICLFIWTAINIGINISKVFISILGIKSNRKMILIHL